MTPRPGDLYDRAQEWSDLVRFAAAPRPRLRLGVLYGRRRFGKSFLLRRLVRQVGGLYHLALEQEPVPALGHFARSVASLHEPGPPLAFADWDQGLRYLVEHLGSRSGFAPGLVQRARARPDVVLVDLERLYEGG